MAEATTREPVSVSAATLPTTTSGLASSRRMSSALLRRSMARMRGLTAWYRPLVLMSSSMPDKRRVSLAAVNTLAPSGIRSLMRGTCGGGVVEDFDGETVCRQRGGRPFQALRGGRVGERCGRRRGGHGASWAGRGLLVGCRERHCRRLLHRDTGLRVRGHTGEAWACQMPAAGR